MTRCQNCGTPSAEDAQYCDECGRSLNGQVEKKQIFAPSNYQPPKIETPVFQSSGATSVGIPAMSFNAEENPVEMGKSANGARAWLIVERGELSGTRFSLVADESNIGRWDADGGVFPDVDLDRFDPEAKISRRHARIIRDEGGRYLIEDLGSTNGTFVNRGRRLLPGNKSALADGDEIIVGKTFLRFGFDR